eukprot:TRINITY_DN8945_c0_g1_i8.p1 TRINITY_DN8945_c0_g1~~TRINITY_DN8945_c0_g1_i8.p1  ORF type:complete len:169 (-),score=36.89 TRINITY_DN8945_c0_g1_i8:25-531(-)
MYLCIFQLLMFYTVFFFFKQKTAYEMLRSLVGSEMCIRDRVSTQSTPILSHINTSHPNVIFWVLWVVVGAIMGYLTVLFRDLVLIFATSALGGFGIVRSFAFFFGGFPNEFTIAQKLQVGELESIPSTVYVYFIVAILVSVGGFIYQLREKRRLDYEEHYIQLIAKQP